MTLVERITEGFEHLTEILKNHWSGDIFLSYLGKQRNGSLFLDTLYPWKCSGLIEPIVRTGVVDVGAPGALRLRGYSGMLYSEEKFPVNPAERYKMKIDIKPLNYADTSYKGIYLFMNFYDIDGHTITIQHCTSVIGLRSNGATPFADQILTVVDYDEDSGLLTLDDVSKIDTETDSKYYRAFRVLGYKNSYGDEYEVYSRWYSYNDLFQYADINTDGNTVLLDKSRLGFANGKLIPGAKIVQFYFGGTYKYNKSYWFNSDNDNKWNSITGGVVTGFDGAGTWNNYKFPQGCAFASFGALINYNNTGGEGECLVTNMTIIQDSTV